MAMMGCTLGYMKVTEDSRAKLGCPVGYTDITEPSGPYSPLGCQCTPPGTESNMAIDPSMAFMYPRGTPARPWSPP
jgi:hypothetical protein